MFLTCYFQVKQIAHVMQIPFAISEYKLNAPADDANKITPF
ncbi:hypothetical protein SEHO0A_00146 [Salmonella enterica subsp. houtenae str. ATCC BAA-1581]|nr:hypothetical protein SEHO0A_00146 [Salmonella enterica subsp. houtenae str. ATCC BAA-1581]ENZ88372.1 hypothetical protein D088_970188 [Salmonella enterica subsp. houtenae serovar 16:z4,z32:-- str. RKS3027]